MVDRQRAVKTSPPVIFCTQETVIHASKARLLSLATLAILVVSAVALARSSLDVLFTQTPGEMKFVADPAHAGYETAVLVGDPAQPGIYAVHTKLPANITIVPHTHSEQWRIATVLSGTLYYAQGDTFDESKLRALGPGSLLVEPKDVPHFAMTKGEEVMLHIVGEGPAATIPVRK
jgi:quercetin dioxygenase-like cupin family protein